MSQSLEARAAPGLPMMPRQAAVDEASAAIGGALHRLAGALVRDDNPRKLREALDSARDHLAPAAELRRTLGAARRKAVNADIEEALSQLILAYPNPPKDVDLAGYGALLARDVQEASPSLFALQSGCVWLRRFRRFLPSVAEVLEAISKAEDLADRADRAAAELPLWVEKAERQLTPQPNPAAA